MLALLFCFLGQQPDTAAWRTAIDKGEVLRFQSWLESGWSPNQVDEDGATPLLRAAIADHLELCQLLLKHGADTNVPSANMKMTALMAAAANQNIGLAEALLKAGAKLDQRDVNGDPPINWAAYYGFTEWVKWALDQGADYQLRGHGNVLEIAIRRGHEPIVQMILAKMGQSPGPGDATGRSALMLAIVQGDPQKALSLLLVPGAAKQSDVIGFSALHHACREGQLEIVNALLKAGADPNQVAGAHGLQLTPLHIAATHGHVAVMAKLVEKGAQRDVVDIQGTSPFGWALSEGQKEASAWLIEHGADLSLPKSFGATAEEMCRSMGWTDLAEQIQKR